MNFYQEKLKVVGRYWNRRVLTEPDFWRICRRLKIRVHFMPLLVTGFYFRCKGKDFITIDSRLQDKERLLIMWHELGHFIMHAPSGPTAANFYHVGDNTRAEQEADAFAWCCVFPLGLLKTKTEAELTVEYNFEPEEIQIRKDIYERYGI